MSANLTPDDVAAHFNISAQKVRDFCHSDRWPHLRIGRDYRFTPAHLAAIEALHEVKPAPKTAAQTWDRVSR